MADRIQLDFGSLTHNQLWQRGMAVVRAQTGNTKYSSTPVTMAVLQSLMDAFKAAIVDATDGSKTAMTRRDSLKAQVISALKQIAVYAQENSNGDPSDSGFKTYTPARKAGQPVTTPTFRKVFRGANSGEIM